MKKEKWWKKKKPELFSSSYEFLLRNCNKIYCFIKACWNLFSKSHQQAKPSIFLCHMETTGELKSALSCFAFWENMVGLSNRQLPHIFCCSLCALSCSICVCSEFFQILFLFNCINRNVHVQDSRHQWTDKCIPVYMQGKKLLSASIARYVSFQSSLLCVSI